MSEAIDSARAPSLIASAGRCIGCALLLSLGFACDAELADDNGSDGNSESLLDGLEDLPGREVSVKVETGKTTYVDLDDGREFAADSGAVVGWELAFYGWDLFTNSGVSGAGNGGGFGPLDQDEFLSAETSEVPFIRTDTTGGAFLDWYVYDGATHQLFSRYHVYGIRDGERLWKLQVLGYYGEQLGAPVSALYQLRYAEVTSEGAQQARTVENLDATAGWPEVSSESKSGCLDLQSGEISSLSPDALSESLNWSLCFRRDAISVNGEQGGPAEVSAVDLHAAEAEDEVDSEVQARTPESEARRFDEVGHEQLTDPGLDYRGDHVVSIFADDWWEGSHAEPRPRPASWLVRSADGERFFSVVVRALEGNRESVSHVTLQVREQMKR